MTSKCKRYCSRPWARINALAAATVRSSFARSTDATAAAPLTRWRTSTTSKVRQRLATMSSSPPPPIQLRAQIRHPRSISMCTARRSAAAPRRRAVACVDDDGWDVGEHWSDTTSAEQSVSRGPHACGQGWNRGRETAFPGPDADYSEEISTSSTVLVLPLTMAPSWRMHLP